MENMETIPKEIWGEIFSFVGSLIHRKVCRLWSGVYDKTEIAGRVKKAPGKYLNTPFVRDIISELPFRKYEYIVSLDRPNEDPEIMMNHLASDLCSWIVKYECENYFDHLQYNDFSFSANIVKGMILCDNPIFLERIYTRSPFVITTNQENMKGKTNWRLALRGLGLVEFGHKEEIFHALNKGNERIIKHVFKYLSVVSSPLDSFYFFSSIINDLQAKGEEDDGFTNYSFFVKMCEKYVTVPEQRGRLKNILIPQGEKECVRIFIRGARKGERCGKKTKRFGLCDVHVMTIRI